MPDVSETRGAQFDIKGRLEALLLPMLGLSVDDRRRFELERVEFNEQRMTAIVPVMVVVNVAMLFAFRSSVDGPEEAFRRGIWWVHFTMLPINLTLWGLVLLSKRRKWRLVWLADVGTIVSTFVGVWYSLTTHRLLPTNNSYLIALFTAALVVRTTLPGAMVAFFGSAAAFVTLLRFVQPSPDVRISFIATAMTAVALSFVVSRALLMAAVRDFALRSTIEKQRDELQAWNTELEQRVETQVRQTLLREREARALDAQLRMKVRARSQELVNAILEGTPEDEMLNEGTVFEQRLVITKLLGSGAMGDVYAGHDTETDQPVAIKLMRRWDGMSPTDVGRFAMEAAATASVVHSAIVRTFHVDVTAAGRLYLVMELVTGQTLASLLERGHFDAAQTARVGAVAAEALAAAHRAGVIHRDIKPSNMMLSKEAPGLRILDFGISKLSVPGNIYQTTAGQIMGTPQYMAPEQILGTDGVTGVSDVYGLGLVLHQMLTGQPTFRAKNMGDLLRAQMVDHPRSLRELVGDTIPEVLSALIARCLDKEPNARPSAEDLARELLGLADALGAPPLEQIGEPRFLRNTDFSPDSHAPTLLAVRNSGEETAMRRDEP